MKKILLFVVLLAAIFLLSLSVFAAQEGVETQNAPLVAEPSSEMNAEPVWTPPTTLEGWIEYIKNDLLPVVVAVLTALAAVYVAVAPILAKIKRASEKFKDATADVNTATDTVRSNETRIRELESKLSEKIESMEQESAANHEDLKDIKEMLRLGLGNTSELVKSGYARRILKIGRGQRETVLKELEAGEESDHESEG